MAEKHIKTVSGHTTEISSLLTEAVVKFWVKLFQRRESGRFLHNLSTASVASEAHVLHLFMGQWGVMTLDSKKTVNTR